MLGLAGAVGKSPRRLKRFVNTDRLLKASLDGLQRETFVVLGGRQGEYLAAMALLRWRPARLGVCLNYWSRWPATGRNLPLTCSKSSCRKLLIRLRGSMQMLPWQRIGRRLPKPPRP